MSKLDQRARFAELRALRQSGKKTFDRYQVDAVNQLYEEVDEDGYKKIVRDRLNQDDFVVDDNGEGYADDGREEWDRVPQYETDSEEDLAAITSRGRRPGKNARKDRQQDEQQQARKDANDRDISQYFTNGAVNNRQAKPKLVKTKEDEDFLAGLLVEVDANVPLPALIPQPPKLNRSTERRRAREPSPVMETRQPIAKRSRTVVGQADSDDDDNFVPPISDTDDPIDTPMLDLTPSSPSPKTSDNVRIKAEDVDNDDDDDEQMMEVSHAGAINTTSVNMAGARPAPKKKTAKVEEAAAAAAAAASSPAKPEAEALDASAWNDINNKLNVVSEPREETRSYGKVDYRDAVEDDGSVNMFWIDYTEVNGSLCLFGKVLNKKTGSYVSCFVKVDNILRKLYFLPREKRLVEGRETDSSVEIMDVYNEVDGLMSKINVGMHKIKPCTRKYAFELPDIPKEAQYLKLLYPYSKPALDMETKGETFSHVFGTNTSLFEQFVLWKNIMGPCWLRIKDGNFGALKNASYCKLEVVVSDPNTMSPLSDSESADAPPLTLMTLALRTTFNTKDNRQEILAISARVYENVSLSDTTPAEKLPCRTFTVMRPHGAAFPLGLEQMASKRGKGVLRPARHEGEVLQFFLAQVDLADPDAILGHQLEGADYSVLLSRLHEKKIHQWSRLGRLRRSQWPGAMGKVGGNSVFVERQVSAGRLLCDLSNDCGRSVMYKCQSWGLTEMCSLYLAGGTGADPRRLEFDNEAALRTWAATRDGLLDYAAHAEADTHLITALALRVQLLPLTRVLTNLAGNSWARTLTGTRAERNEYILLHEFHRNKYICPDKQQAFKGRQGGVQTGQGRKQGLDDENDDDGVGGDGGGGGGGGSGAGKKKDKYKGGLVFEPEKGLYDKFVLVMDFNSLYPSIIQEFNICFTTVNRNALSEDEEGVPEVPVDHEQGILPRLIATLVSRRRQVKSLMKDKKATAEQLATWDIKQLALKLTANSMYGCLGYTRSRFYARPLAVLTTYKGREILRSTKDLAESRSLQVIYGDTDSVMINANVDSVADALRVGAEFRRAVNERYRLLEIDVDNVFRRILLQAKKKYAAINLVEQGGRFVEKMEVKGLDMKRREYCALSKEVSARLLDEILSGNDAEVSVARIHEYLRETAARMRGGAVPATKYIIFTQLGKAPRDYPQADTMPQVQVALRDLARGKTVRKGDVVGYIITGDGSSSDPAPKRAYAPADVTRAESGLAPDVEWYIGKQIFPPVERLCANISATSTVQLAEQLGIDIRRYTTTSSTHSGGGGGGSDSTSPLLDMHPLDSQVSDDVRFRDCARLSLRCRACKTTATFEGLFPTSPSLADRVSASGIVCTSCGAVMATVTAAAQLEHAIRRETTRYYEGWLVCDDSQCGVRTRQMSVCGTRCLGPKGLARDCLGRMRYEYSEKAIYNQLLYFGCLFDADKAHARAGREPDLAAADRERILALSKHNKVRFDTLKSIVDRYLDKCGRQWVNMDALFARLGFMRSQN